MSLLRLILAVLWAVVCVVCSAQVQDQNAVSCDLTSNTSASLRYGGSTANLARGNVSKLPIRSLLYPGSETRIYARYMPWFGDPHHRDVGYRSDDAQQVQRQVADMSGRGIHGAIVDWYGPGSSLKNESTILLMKESERQNFQFAVSEDTGALGDCAKHGCDVTAQLISDLRFAAEHFESSSSYIRFEGRPALFFFGLEKFSIDWHRVRKSLPLNPLFFFRNSVTFANSDADGAYAWIAPETATTGDPRALQYLERFYSRAQHSNKIAMGSAYKGFDDSGASWGKGHVIPQDCGQTWLASFDVVRHFYSAKYQLTALIIPTWNDYEEGTEIETGIDNCVRVTASVSGDKLVWTVFGQESTLDHFAILGQAGSRWIDAANLPAQSRSIPLRNLPLLRGTSALCVLAIGKPSLTNHSSGPVRYSPSGTSPSR